MRPLLWVLILVSQPWQDAAAAEITASGCSQNDVQAAVDAAAEGDTIIVPPGTCHWTKPVAVGRQVGWNPTRYADQKALTIAGGGIDATIIIDDAPKDRAGLFSIISQAGKAFHLTGFTFRGGDTPTGSKGVIELSGSSSNWRISNCKFDLTKSRPILVSGAAFGVIHHSEFSLNGTGGVYISHGSWGGHSHGDGSWADKLSLGTGAAVYIEDNVFHTPGWVDGFVDSAGGARWVFRHNQAVNMGIGNHGTDSTGRTRGTFSYEIYHNNFERSLATAWWTVFHSRSGTGVMFANTIQGRFNSLAVLSVYRAWHGFTPFGACDGTSPFDFNAGKVFDAGLHTGADSSPSLLAAARSWEAKQWVGYALHNKSTNKSGMITDNSPNTITVAPDPYAANLTWQSGDTFEILRAYPCLDQVGRGTSRLISGAAPLPQEWPQQQQEPFYQWNNTLNGASTRTIGRPPLVENQDYLNNTPRPQYTPFIYPHPLTIAPFGSEICPEGEISRECWCEGLKTRGSCRHGVFQLVPGAPGHLRVRP